MRSGEPAGSSSTSGCIAARCRSRKRSPSWRARPASNAPTPGPGASTGIGAPTDRPERIAEQLVAGGARLIHLVDFDGARSGRPENLEAVGAIAARIAVPLQLAGGVDTADGIRLAFAAGATRVVTSMAIVDDPDGLAAALEVAGSW